MAKYITQKIKKILKGFGPGFITGASDDDPSGIATYIQTGAQFGYQQLWTALFSFPFMAVVQEISGRIGLVTGSGLAKLIKTHYSKKILGLCVIFLALANIINIAADLNAMSASLQLLFSGNFIFWLCAITVISIGLQILVPYKIYAQFLKYTAFSLIAYVVVAFITTTNWKMVLMATITPHIAFEKTYLLNLVAILGTTISPYLFFWQANEEVEEEIAHHKITIKTAAIRLSPKDIFHMRADTIWGMLFSNLIMLFIIITGATTLGNAGITNITTAQEAAQALAPISGQFSSLLFTLGIIGTGFLAVPILAGSLAYAVAESFDWKIGLYRKFSSAKKFYWVIAGATLLGALLNSFRIPPFTMLYYAAILNGLVAPILLVIIMKISSNKSIMGEYKNPYPIQILGWTITGVMALAAIGLLATLLG